MYDAIALSDWYQKNKRSLPWRDTGNPYDVWLSEIMLQQTRIEAVKDKFIAFKKELPSIRDLAECGDDRLMKLWEGMGYYSRARNLKKCAQVLMKEYHGKLPDDYESLIKLPGIGPYTAGAVASIAYGKPAAAVDGNVLRVLARYFNNARDIRDAGVRKEYDSCIRNVFREKSDPDFVRNFNQGLMELGETVCIPKGSPLCPQCPFRSSCQASIAGCTGRIPFRSSLKKRKIVNRTILVIRDGSKFLLHKRPEKGLLAGLYEFPGVDAFLTRKEAAGEVQKLGAEPFVIKRLPDSKHIFTHLEWHMHAWEVKVGDVESLRMENCLFLSKKELQNFAVPSAFHAYKDWYSLND